MFEKSDIFSRSGREGMVGNMSPKKSIIFTPSLREAAKKVLLLMAGPLTLKGWGYFTNEKDGGGEGIMPPPRLSRLVLMGRG